MAQEITIQTLPKFLTQKNHAAANYYYFQLLCNNRDAEEIPGILLTQLPTPHSLPGDHTGKETETLCPFY